MAGYGLWVNCVIAPEPASPIIAAAVEAGGGTVVDVSTAGAGGADALVWTDPRDAAGLQRLLGGAAAAVTWVQLPFAGVDNFVSLLDQDRRWTSTKGAYAEPVAEHALALGLAGLRGLGARARARPWGRPAGRRLMDGRVTVLGGGGIAEALIRLLAPFRVAVTVVRRDAGAAVEGATRVVGREGLAEALAGADLVVLALALTPETEGIIGARELAAMEPHAWLVNVARGAHVVTDDLVAALRDGVIGGAALDVTDPEPLPDGHPLWSLDNCLITPHVANTWAMAEPLFAERVRENVRRFGAGEPLLGVVDPVLGY